MLLSIDQGTTLTRAVIFDYTGNVVRRAQRVLKQIYPSSACGGWVEHDAEGIWNDVISVLEEVGVTDVEAIGIASQRESIVVWERDSGKPIYNSICWQDRRECKMNIMPDANIIRQKTGLRFDPSFSATKICWILDNVCGAREKAEKGFLAAGTIDSWLVWRLTGGTHITDCTNASRTSLFDIEHLRWDVELCRLFRVPMEILPPVCSSAEIVGYSPLINNAPISGLAGDQHAALIGQAVIRPGMGKATIGTGCFLMINTGDVKIQSKYGLITTIAYQINGKTTYALEGSILSAGATFRWLKEQFDIDVEKFTEDDDDDDQDDQDGQDGTAKTTTTEVYVVPAFVGLAAPQWQPNARGLISGITFATGKKELARAALRAVSYQVNDLFRAVQADIGDLSVALRLDGGGSKSSSSAQFMADILRFPVERPKDLESSARGAAFLAGLGVGIYKNMEEIEQLWSMKDRFEPRKDAKICKQLIKGWEMAVKQALLPTQHQREKGIKTLRDGEEAVECGEVAAASLVMSTQCSSECNIV